MVMSGGTWLAPLVRARLAARLNRVCDIFLPQRKMKFVAAHTAGGVRVPDALQRLQRCCAEPGPRSRIIARQRLGPGSAAHHAAKTRRAALRPGHEIWSS